MLEFLLMNTLCIISGEQILTGICGGGTVALLSCGEEAEGLCELTGADKSVSIPEISIFPKFSSSDIILLQSALPSLLSLLPCSSCLSNSPVTIGIIITCF